MIKHFGKITLLKMQTPSFRRKRRISRKEMKDVFSLKFLPNELAIKIFDLVGKEDLLNCRLTCWAICRQINDCYLSRYDFHLNDKVYKKLFQGQHRKLSFSPQCALHVQTLQNSLSVSTVRMNFENITTLTFSTYVSEENFFRILKCAANLKFLRLGCSALGGTEKLFPNAFLYADGEMDEWENSEGKNAFPSLVCSQLTNVCRKTKSTSGRYEIPIGELHLNFSYIPFSGKKGFCDNLTRNLNSLQRLCSPALSSLEFSIESSDLQEKYMFSVGQLFKAIPKCSYKTLRKLVITGPCFYFRHQNNQELLDEILNMKLQLNHFVLNYDTKYDRENIPWIISEFLESQNSLNYVKIIFSGTVLQSKNYSHFNP